MIFNTNKEVPLSIKEGGTGADSKSKALINLGLTTSPLFINRCDGVKENIQDQLDSKSPKTHTHDAYVERHEGSFDSITGGYLTLNNALNVKRDATITGTLTVSGATTIGQTLKVSGTATMGRIDASNEYLTGSLYVGGKSSTSDGKNGVAFGSTGNVFMQGNSPTVNFMLAGKGATVGAKIFITDPGDGYTHLKFKADDKYFVFRKVVDSGYDYDACLYSETDGGCMLGTPSFRWYRIYASNSSISTSDKRKKENIKYLNGEDMDVYGELFDRLKPTEYNLIDGDGKKNIGLIAQDVLESMHELGIEENELDLVHHDVWVDKESGEEKDAYGIAYENLIAMLIHEVQKLKGNSK